MDAYESVKGRVLVSTRPRGKSEPEGDTHPSKRYQTPFFRKLQHQLFFVHSASITRRMLLRNQQRRHHILAPLILPQQQPTRLPILQRIHPRNRQKLRQALPREPHRLQIPDIRILGPSRDDPLVLL